MALSKVPAAMTDADLATQAELDAVSAVATAAASAVVTEASTRAASFAAFKGIPNAMTSITNAPVKITLQAESFDTLTSFDTTNSRYQPSKAGFYQIQGCVRFGVSGSSCYSAIYKNGALYAIGNYGTQDASTVADVVYLNGTTDYVELWAQSTTTQNNVISQTFLSGFLVRAD